jgi:FkbM family methyltransferase
MTKAGAGDRRPLPGSERRAWLSNAANTPTAGAIATGNAPVAAGSRDPGGLELAREAMDRPTSLIVWAIQKRILRGKLRHAVQRALIGKAHSVTIGGLKLCIHLGDNSTEADILAHGVNARRVGLSKLLDGLKLGDVFVDVGANCGIFTTFAADRVGPGGQVVAIEPIPEMVRRLRLNVATNGFGNVAIFESAVGEQPGTSYLSIYPHNYGQSTMSVRGAAEIKVNVEPLAQIIAAAGVDRIDTLKIDIEGFEDRALMPFIATAPRSLWPRRIIMETIHRARWRTDCVKALLQAGYGKAWSSGYDIALEQR